MSNILRGTIFAVGGLCWFAAAFFLAVFAWAYITVGAGVQFFGLSVSSGSVLLGLIHLCAGDARRVQMDESQNTDR